MRWVNSVLSLENVLFQTFQHMKTGHINVTKDSFCKCTELYRFVIKQHQKERRPITNTNEISSSI